MMRVRESPAGEVGMMDGLARNAAFSAGEICVGAWPLSRFRAFTKSMCDDTPAVYAANAVAISPSLYAASALMNCSCEYVMRGSRALSSKM